MSLNDIERTGIVLLTALAVACGAEQEPLPAGGASFEEGPPLASAAGKADSLASSLDAYGALPADADLDRPLAALFAPDDPVATLEATLIDKIRAARKRDPASYAEGDNPFRIRYAVYNLRNALIGARLAAAEGDGVDVQILLESDQLSPDRTWNTMDEELVKQGFELVADHRTLDDTTRKSADLIGIKASGLMHLKARIFEAPGYSAVLSGSCNPGDHAMANEETLHLIRDTRLIARYGAAFEAVRDRKGLANSWDDSAAVNVMFTPASSGPRASTRLLKWIAEEKEQILLMVFSLRDVSAPGVSGSLVDLLAAKAAAGVPVIVITDRKQSDGVDAQGQPLYYNDRTEDRLRAAGVSVYEATNSTTPYTAMHHKVGILGRSRVRVITDAANWTKAGLGSASRRARNVESVLFIDSAALDKGLTGRRYIAQWLRVLQRYATQSSGDGEPGYTEVYAALAAQPGWATQPISFLPARRTPPTASMCGCEATSRPWDGGGQPARATP